MPKNLSSAYAKRLASGLARGLTKSQTVGHSKPHELLPSAIRLALKNPKRYSEIAKAIEVNNPALNASVNRLMRASGGVFDNQNPLFEPIVEVIQDLARTPASHHQTGMFRGLIDDRATVTVHVVRDKLNSELSGKERFKTFTSDGRGRKTDVTLAQAIADAQDYDPDYDIADDTYSDVS